MLVLRRALFHLAEYEAANPTTMPLVAVPSTHSTRSSVAWLNTDADFSRRIGHVSTAALIRDSNGSFIAASSSTDYVRLLAPFASLKSKQLKWDFFLLIISVFQSWRP
ncbi:hypothetical protein NE237_022603 [Protea cynaroides]|uniref:Uncharacterized protein n=1 Tax=Protea cynaroides TaxID=273540 RepID=A0A9Q0HFJ9_9MAGN|nr:hypothetical protein NE237_022603 [Protea cynaroides]